MRINIDAIELEIEKRNWSMAKFARKAQLSRSYVSRVLARERAGGLDFLEGVMIAFPDIDFRDILILEKSRF